MLNIDKLKYDFYSKSFLKLIEGFEKFVYDHEPGKIYWKKDHNTKFLLIEETNEIICYDGVLWRKFKEDCDIHYSVSREKINNMFNLHLRNA